MSVWSKFKLSSNRPHQVHAKDGVRKRRKIKPGKIPVVTSPSLSVAEKERIVASVSAQVARQARKRVGIRA